MSSKKKSTFQAAFQLYSFDRELRVLLLRELEKIEVTIRAKMIYILSHNHGAFWYQNAYLFKSHVNHSKSLGRLEDEYNRSDEEFINAFKLKYSDKLPLSWIMLEIVPFGTLSFLYGNLKPSRSKRNITKHFGLNDSAFSSWLHSIFYLRNVCAHHSRLWNRVMRIQPIIPRTNIKVWLSDKSVHNKKIFFIFSTILYLMQTINPGHSIIRRFKNLLRKYPNVDVSAMGFPENWKNESLWSEE